MKGAFGNPCEARQKIASWRKEPDEGRAHGSLKHRRLEEVAREMGAISTAELIKGLDFELSYDLCRPSGQLNC
jgi:hypothetical protein